MNFVHLIFYFETIYPKARFNKLSTFGSLPRKFL